MNMNIYYKKNMFNKKCDILKTKKKTDQIKTNII